MISWDLLQTLKDYPAVGATVSVGGVAAVLSQPPIRRVYLGYGIALLAVLLAALQKGDLLYFYAFTLGFLTAFTEIIGKFTDEPIKALRTPAALLYHVSNGLISVFALWILVIGNFVPAATPFEKLKLVTLAGLGSMLIMRSKLFDAKIGNESVSVGPEQFIKVFFNYMERAIDRLRSQHRIDFVQTRLKNLDCRKVIAYVETMLDAPQALERTEKEALVEKMRKIAADASPDAQYRSYRLGFLLLNEMGEDFVSRLFENPRPEWLIAAQKPGDREGLLSRLPFVGAKEEYASYFAYGKSMSLDDLVRRLNWSPGDVKQLQTERPRPAFVKGYRLEFSGLCGEGSKRGEGCANLEPADGERVWGVLLRVPKNVLDFLDAAEPGYEQRQVKCEAEGKDIEAVTFVADPPWRGLRPNKSYLVAMIKAAEELGLDAAYIETLKRRPALEEAAIAVAVSASHLCDRDDNSLRRA